MCVFLIHIAQKKLSKKKKKSSWASELISVVFSIKAMRRTIILPLPQLLYPPINWLQSVRIHNHTRIYTLLSSACCDDITMDCEVKQLPGTAVVYCKFTLNTSTPIPCHMFDSDCSILFPTQTSGATETADNLSPSIHSNCPRQPLFPTHDI